MWDSYRRDLRRAVRASPGREKGLLVANYEAEREVYGTSSLTLSTLREGVKDISLPDELWQFNTVKEAQERLSAYLSNIQSRYLRVRETLANLRGTFIVFMQYKYVEELLNDISWGKGKALSGVSNLRRNDGEKKGARDGSG